MTVGSGWGKYRQAVLIGLNICDEAGMLLDDGGRKREDQGGMEI